MNNFIGDTTGLVHVISAVFALISGTMIITMKKGTKRHVQVGYLYVISMVVLIVTAFMIYRLFGGWGVFHYASVVSLISISLGMIPIWLKKPVNNWRYLHFTFMYWSVIGLYAAFAAEMFTRIPNTPFLGMVGIVTGVIMLIGGLLFGLKKASWRTVFEYN